jgi:nucleoside-diphosphate-sugar epimerase
VIGHVNREPRTPNRVVVIGARGFIGGALAAELRAQGIPLLPISSADIDLTDSDATPKLAARIRPEDSVVRLAALTPDRGRDLPTLMRNLKMGQALSAALELSPCAHLLYISSDAVYPFDEAVLSEKSHTDATTLYGIMHRTREVMIQNAVSCPLLILRPTQVFGLRDTHDSYGPNRMRRSAATERRIVLFGAGDELRDHILIDDLVELIYQLLTHRSRGILNAATGKSVSYRELARMIAGHFEVDIEIVGTPRQRPITHRRFDPTACLKAFPEFRFTPLTEALATLHREMLRSARAG